MVFISSLSLPFGIAIFQVSVLADDILKNVEYDALRIVFNKFHSVVSFIPTVSTVLSPEVIQIAAPNNTHLFWIWQFLYIYDDMLI